MWAYEKRLQYPVNIKNPNPKLAQLIITQLGGPDGETGAAMRYLSQRYSMPYSKVKATLTDIGQTYTSEISEMSPKAEQNELININTATAEELKQLNGIGDVIAARIVEYAQTIGFNSIEDIKNVKGIGDKKYDNIKDKITV